MIHILRVKEVRLINGFESWFLPKIFHWPPNFPGTFNNLPTPTSHFFLSSSPPTSLLTKVREQELLQKHRVPSAISFPQLATQQWEAKQNSTHLALHQPLSTNPLIPGGKVVQVWNTQKLRKGMRNIKLANAGNHTACLFQGDVTRENSLSLWEYDANSKTENRKETMQWFCKIINLAKFLFSHI